MTRDEAAEVILGGPLWMTCTAPNCRNGYVYKPAGNAIDCSQCKGGGRVACRAYREACVILSLPFPKWDRARNMPR